MCSIDATLLFVLFLSYGKYYRRKNVYKKLLNCFFLLLYLYRRFVWHLYFKFIKSVSDTAFKFIQIRQKFFEWRDCTDSKYSWLRCNIIYILNLTWKYRGRGMNKTVWNKLTQVPFIHTYNWWYFSIYYIGGRLFLDFVMVCWYTKKKHELIIVNIS